jgi:hypothetical protein
LAGSKPLRKHGLQAGQKRDRDLARGDAARIGNAVVKSASPALDTA